MLKIKNKILFTGVVQRNNKTRIISATLGKVGGTSGWTTRAANNTDLATCAASQTGAKYIIPIDGLRIGDIITAFNLVGQIESAGGAVTLDADLRKMTAAAADPGDASITTMTQLSVTADTAITSANASKTLATPEVVVAGCTYYLVLTATTAASTDIALQGVGVTIREQ